MTIFQSWLLPARKCAPAFLLGFLLLMPASAQVVLEQWGCDSIVSATATNPVILTCNTPHGFSAGATWWVRIYGGTGNWATINTQWGTRALGSTQASDTTIELVDASPQEIGGTITLPYCNACGGVEGPGTVTAIHGNVLTLNRTNPTFHYASAFFYSPGSSAADVVLNAHRRSFYTATAIGPNTFSIPVDGSSFGSWPRKSVVARRVNGNGAFFGTDYTGANNNPGLTSTIEDGAFTEVFPAITDPMNARQLIATRSGTAGFLVVHALAAGNAVTVSAGTGHFNLSSLWAFQGDIDRRLTVGTLVYLDGFQDTRLNDAFVVTSLDGDPPSGFTFSANVPDGTYPGIASGAGLAVAQRGLPNPDFQVADANGAWSFPMGYLQGYVKSGTWTPTLNRLYTWIKLSNGYMQRRSNNGYTGTFGSYQRIRNTNANTPQYHEHWYHYYNSNLYDGVWARVVLNAHPTHQVGGGTWEAPNDPTYSGFVGVPSYLGDQQHYFDGMGRLYLDVEPKTRRDFVGAKVSLGSLVLDTVTGEPDNSVSTVVALWSPARFTQLSGCAADGDVGQPACTGARGGGPGFEVSWSAPIFDKITYEVRRSSTSMKLSGFSSGVCNDGSTVCTAAGGDLITGDPRGGYSQVQWVSSKTESAQPSDTYIAIRPQFKANWVSGVGVSPIWIGSHTAFDMETGDRVTISGVRGNTAANQDSVAIVDQKPVQNWWRYDPIGVQICGMTGSGVSPIQITTCSPHNIPDGTKVRVDASTGNHLPIGNTASGGYWTVAVVDATHLSLLGSTGNGTYSPVPYGVVHGPGMLDSIQATSGTCSLTTTQPHGLLAGMRFTIVGSTNAVLGPSPSGSEALSTVSSVSSPTTLTFACAGVPNGIYTDEVGSTNQFSIRTDPAIAIGGTGDGDWTSGGTIVSAEPFRNFTEIELQPYDPFPGQHVPVRFGGPKRPMAAILLYTAPDDQPCTTTLSGGGTGTFQDGGGARTRTQALNGLLPSTSYQFRLRCSNGGAAASGEFSTSSGDDAAGTRVFVVASPPAVAPGADGLVVDYGDSADVLNASVTAACTAPQPCSASLPNTSSSVLWVRRRWCRNHAADPQCSLPANELARSAPEAVLLR